MVSVSGDIRVDNKDGPVVVPPLLFARWWVGVGGGCECWDTLKEVFGEPWDVLCEWWVEALGLTGEDIPAKQY